MTKTEEIKRDLMEALEHRIALELDMIKASVKIEIDRQLKAKGLTVKSLI